MNLNRFEYTPTTINYSRTKFPLNHSLHTTFNFGDVVPILTQEVLPGDTYSLDLRSVCRMSTPNVPVMDNAFMDKLAFFVPCRTLWEHWEAFMGQNDSFENPWVSPTEYFIPMFTHPGQIDSHSVAAYMGVPLNAEPGLEFSQLPHRAYLMIWNYYFRDQNVMLPCYINKGDTDVEYKDDVSDYVYGMNGGGKCLRASKLHDYFTSALPAPQKGAAVGIPAQGLLPVLTFHAATHYDPDLANSVSWSEFSAKVKAAYTGSAGAALSFIQHDGTSDSVSTALGLHLNNLSGSSSNFSTTGKYYVPDNLVAPLNNLEILVNDLRYSVAVQHMLELDARGGTRYKEIIYAHFGVKSADARLDIPEFIGARRDRIDMQQVLNTTSTGEVSSGNVSLGATGAYSLTTTSSDMFTYSATEHGYIIVVAVARTENSYQQGLPRMFSRKQRYDFYDPCFANIGEQPIYIKELMANSGDYDDVFGYKEAWAEYRVNFNRISGMFNSDYNQPLDVWHYGQELSGTPVLGEDFIYYDKSVVDRTLKVGSDVVDQLLCDFYFDMSAVRVMPVYSVPGIDRI